MHEWPLLRTVPCLWDPSAGADGIRNHAGGSAILPAKNDIPRTEGRMTVGTLLIIILVLLLIGAIPSWPYSRGWGYAPSGGLGLILVVVVILLLLGRI
jgi:hypothetical protein